MHYLKKTLRLFFILILTVSCSKRQYTLDQYAQVPVKFGKQKIISPNNDFTVFIPKNWTWKVENYDNENIVLGIDAGSQPDEIGFIDIISIQKVKSLDNSKDLKSEFDYLSAITQNQSKGMKIIESGETNIFKQKAYFTHTKSDTGTYGESEMISFILESKKDGVYYHLNAGASQTKDLKKNMAIIIQSLKTFEIHSNE